MPLRAALFVSILFGLALADPGVSARAESDSRSPSDLAASLVSLLDIARTDNPEIRAVREKARAAEERAKVEAPTWTHASAWSGWGSRGTT